MLSPKTGKQSTIMKKLICILASAALLGACEQKTETVTPAAAPADNKKTESNTTIVNPPADKTKETNTNTITTAPAAEKKTETTTTTSTSPNP